VKSCPVEDIVGARIRAKVLHLILDTSSEFRLNWNVKSRHAHDAAKKAEIPDVTIKMGQTPCDILLPRGDDLLMLRGVTV
jgi:hypothetical protein